MPATVFRNARLFDGRRHRGEVGDVVAADGRIVSVGERHDTAGARVVDVAGGLLSPGFTDAHVHAVQGGLERIRCDLSGTTERAAAYVDAVGAYAAAHPDLEWILGGGWAMSAFPGGTPTAAALDAVVPDRPVFLPNRDHHGAWVNSLALRLAGITRDTPDPADGRIERDAAGEPTGTLHEGAMGLVAHLVPRTSEEELYRGLLAGQEYLHSLGVTAWQDAIVGAYAGMDDNGPTYAAAARAGDLTASVVGALWWDRGRGPEQIPELVERRDVLSVGRFAATSVKIMQDGVAENGTAAMLESYLDRCGHHTGNHGISFVEPTGLREAVAELDRLGFQVHVHGLGDRAVREALDALADADPAHRHHIAHLQFVHPDDVPRFAAHGVAANIQALWACLDDQMIELTLPFLSPEQAARQYPFGSLHRAGARLVAGSDWPVSTPDPWQALHVAVHRTAHGDDAEPLLPAEALDLETALGAYTAGSAWVCGRDDAGRIEPGAVADLVMLDRDPFTGDEPIGATRVVSTWVAGEPVWGQAT